MAADKREFTFAQTFPTGTHAMWLYYWLAAIGHQPDEGRQGHHGAAAADGRQHAVGNMDGFCVGEPWNHRAIIDGIGVTAATARRSGRTIPRRCSARPPTSSGNPNTARAVMPRHHRGRPVDRCQPVEQEPKMAETIADKAYVNTSVDAINQRILGRYQNGLGQDLGRPGTT